MQRDPVCEMTSFGRTTTCGRVLETDLRGLSPTEFYQGLWGAIAEPFADLYPDLPLDPKSVAGRVGGYTKRQRRARRTLLAHLDSRRGSIYLGSPFLRHFFRCSGPSTIWDRRGRSHLHLTRLYTPRCCSMGH